MPHSVIQTRADLTIWLLRGVWVISEKNILKTDLEGKNSYKEIPGEKIPTLEKFH